MDSNKRILIISNNALSLTSNNGKTLWSLFEDYPKKNINQLFTREELPSLVINSYYRITNKDVIKGRISKEHRGGEICTVSSTEQEEAYKVSTPSIRRTSLNCLLREMLWLGGWKSKKLDEWIKSVNPDIIFFVAGDTLYSYRICEYIANRTKASVNVYITDDYICKRSKENIFDALKRRLVLKRLREIIGKTHSFFTISDKMRAEYLNLLGKDSMPVFNISERLYKNEYNNGDERNELLFIYTGSLYYGRDEILIEIAKRLSELSRDCNNLIKLEVYSNQEPDKSIVDKLMDTRVALYGGSLNKDSLIEKLNKADVLLFVESFATEQIEKTRLSLSTKISEYLSVGKPIIAVGPASIGSMEFLSDAAICINNFDDLSSKLKFVITDKSLREMYGRRAIKKYERIGDLRSLRRRFIDALCEN